MRPDPAHYAPGAHVMSLPVGAERRSREPAGFLLLKLPDSPPGVTARECSSLVEPRLPRRPGGLQRNRFLVSPPLTGGDKWEGEGFQVSSIDNLGHYRGR